MQREVENVEYPENGPRFTAVGTFDGARITVATGYDGVTDSWPYHVYVDHEGAMRAELTQKPSQFTQSTKDKALAQGLALAANLLSPRPFGFQREVKR